MPFLEPVPYTQMTQSMQADFVFTRLSGNTVATRPVARRGHRPVPGTLPERQANKFFYWLATSESFATKSSRAVKILATVLVAITYDPRQCWNFAVALSEKKNPIPVTPWSAILSRAAFRHCNKIDNPKTIFLSCILRHVVSTITYGQSTQSRLNSFKDNRLLPS